ncbi:hypothetical protein [Sporosarcina sp. FSL W7-1283]|uniref:hypothetical protein n=1 Tax=Sporosarcina sp. FSL W7-1283 TaxID=2921560 RepID=UPI0030F52932
MKGKQIEFDKDEQEARFVSWEDGALNITIYCTYGGSVEIELSSEDVGELIKLINKNK